MLFFLNRLALHSSNVLQIPRLKWYNIDKWRYWGRTRKKWAATAAAQPSKVTLTDIPADRQPFPWRLMSLPINMDKPARSTAVTKNSCWFSTCFFYLLFCVLCVDFSFVIGFGGFWEGNLSLCICVYLCFLCIWL